MNVTHSSNDLDPRLTPTLPKVQKIEKVLLINPFLYESKNNNVGIDPVVTRHAGQQIKTGVTYPIGLAYLAATLKEAGFQYHLMDPIAEDFTTEEIHKWSEWADAIIIPFSPSHQQHTRRYFNRFSHKLRIICGGVATHIYDHLFKEDFADVVLMGEPEETVVVLAQKYPALKDVDGIVFRNPDGSSTKTKTRPPIKDLDAVPFPVRDFTDPANYWDISYWGKPTAWILPTRGCPYKCTFCAQWEINQLKTRKRSAKNVVDEIEEVVNKHGVRNFAFFDEIFNLTPSYVHQICDEIIARKLDIKWWCAARPDRVREDVVKKMMASGCIEMRFGLESANDEILKYLKKDTTVEEIRKGIDITRKCGMNFSLHVIFGAKMESQKTVRETMDFVKAVKPLFVSFNVLTPLPGSQLFEENKHKIDMSKGLANFDILHTDFSLGEFTPAQLSQIVKMAYLEYYLSPGFLFRVTGQVLKNPTMAFFIAKTMLVQAGYIFSSVVTRTKTKKPEMVAQAEPV